MASGSHRKLMPWRTMRRGAPAPPPLSGPSEEFRYESFVTTSTFPSFRAVPRAICPIAARQRTSLVVVSAEVSDSPAVVSNRSLPNHEQPSTLACSTGRRTTRTSMASGDGRVEAHATQPVARNKTAGAFRMASSLPGNAF